MCHVILMMPVLALPLFWVLPLGQAVPVYSVIAVISGLIYWRISVTHGGRPQTGAETLIGTTAEVVSSQEFGSQARYLVRSHGELWGATSPDSLKPGDTVAITALNGIRLVVAISAPESDGEVRQRQSKDQNERG